jgi:uncharacterized protein with PIN domain
MVIDTSALIAILFREPEADALVEAILRDSRRYLGAATYVENGRGHLRAAGTGWGGRPGRPAA